jgi:hypothetical protein
MVLDDMEVVSFLWHFFPVIQIQSYFLSPRCSQCKKKVYSFVIPIVKRYKRCAYVVCNSKVQNTYGSCKCML